MPRGLAELGGTRDKLAPGVETVIDCFNDSKSRGQHGDGLKRGTNFSALLAQQKRGAGHLFC